MCGGRKKNRTFKLCTNFKLDGKQHFYTVSIVLLRSLLARWLFVIPFSCDHRSGMLFEFTRALDAFNGWGRGEECDGSKVASVSQKPWENAPVKAQWVSRFFLLVFSMPIVFPNWNQTHENFVCLVFKLCASAQCECGYDRCFFECGCICTEMHIELSTALDERALYFALVVCIRVK